MTMVSQTPMRVFLVNNKITSFPEEQQTNEHSKAPCTKPSLYKIYVSTSSLSLHQPIYRNIFIYDSTKAYLSLVTYCGVCPLFCQQMREYENNRLGLSYEVTNKINKWKIVNILRLEKINHLNTGLSCSSTLLLPESEYLIYLKDKVTVDCS